MCLLVIDPSNPISVGPDGTIARTLPDGQSAGEVLSRWLPKGMKLAKAFGALPPQLLSSGANRAPDRAVLFFATDDPATATEVERLIRIAGFETHLRALWQPARALTRSFRTASCSS
jgi:8-hydroxy-5-deazaflavin:NADPH oxidoreductase